ncbi:acyl-CoA dehydrogenase [Geodermatophilus obscurus]|uniref:Broad-specificity linear acyl-CoA dehydrogenase FadE5 n=1 Tax=Geodermatophilus obscurus (strain ATCC 25078 / DSM 43160 / JCM 3152 / CCUG 61914 / KCC A-0152 / KCTC 9177 / NBRC 13315 / NRRL B-3577 / G-20) TaxID=526225 RepID=D2S5W2_GEOOG|nr:acyl-CoA dehydrogenase [Geodermatophilus obscurus]ADB77368.1 acyl-CoA dehydrogenase domain protein [Geodermatophilus obscurus DSM 43160]
MSHYTANLRDLEFNLFEFLDTKDRFGTGPFAQMDTETARGVLAEVRRLAEGPIAASFADADRNPPVFDPATNSVTLPESFKGSVRAIEDGEWFSLDLPEHLGGFGAPHALTWAAFEMVLGANPAVFMYGSWAAFAAILDELGTPDQKRLARLMLQHKWGATMVLTEPDAGSDVGAGRTRAVRQDDGSWHLTGVKRFITSAEHDLSDNIVHLVLARPEGAGPGTKGLSLFVVPKFHVDLLTGALGERNGVYVTNVERKMGLKVSTTCELTFGDGPVPAKGWLVGEVHDGIAQMFEVIEHARMFVGAKAIATLSAGYQVALDYAKNRIQGADLTATGKDAPRVPITRHPDVRRSLMLQKSYAEGMRALYLYTATFRDQVTEAEAAGTADSEEARLAARVNDLLLPLVKGFGSERATQLLTAESLQTLGGSGYLQDYPIEQYIRDSKIDTLYEGTTAIQGQDFFFRKIVKDGGVALTWLAGRIQDTIDAEVGNGRLKEERAALATALGDVQAMLAALFGHLTAAQEDVTSLYKVGQNTSRLLLAAGDLITAWLLVRQAEVALGALAGEVTSADRHFYEGKLAAVRFFTTQVLPRLSSERVIVENTDNALMEVDEAAL